MANELARFNIQVSRFHPADLTSSYKDPLSVHPAPPTRQLPWNTSGMHLRRQTCTACPNVPRADNVILMSCHTGSMAHAADKAQRHPQHSPYSLRIAESDPSPYESSTPSALFSWSRNEHHLSWLLNGPMTVCEKAPQGAPTARHVSNLQRLHYLRLRRYW